MVQGGDSSGRAEGPVIHLLPEVVRNQIAAGEVVERPASVVKELVDNALDAGATRIRVDLEEGGVKLVRVTDDGCGMGPEDLALAFQPFATSKLASPDDLDHIATLGFRGEALASIGSVARCRILSRPRASLHGHEVTDEGGRVGPVREAGATAGTVIEVRDLFFNTPARRRFLKTRATELSRCLDLLQRLALAHVGVGFEVTHDGRRVVDVEPEMDLRDRVRRFFGAELADALVAMSERDGTTVVEGLVAPPRFSRNDTSRQLWWLNGRPLRDKVLMRCLKDAYRGFLVEGRQPVAFLALAMNPALVDVNVHPQKTEVRFREQRRVFGFLQRVLREAVRTTDMATPGERMLEIASRRERRSTEPFVFTPGARPAPPASPGHGGHSHADHEHALERGAHPDPGAWPAGPPGPGGPGGAVRETSPAAADEGDGGAGGIRGPFLQVARTYLLRALPDGFEIVDQHALHERLTFEELKREVASGAVAVQRLLVPEPVDVGPAQARLLESHQEALESIGIRLARFGEGTVSVDGIPARLRRADVEGLVRDVLEIVQRTGQAPDAEEVLEEVLHSAACRSSIMAGDRLDESEIRSLLERAAALESDQTCPHARPTRVRFTTADLEKAFHRR